MRKISFLLILSMFTVAPAYAGQVQISTYYPSPFGYYERLKFNPRTSLTEPCEPGTVYYLSGTGLKYCAEDTLWKSMGGGVWTQSGNSIYPADTATNPSLKVGIGTTTPDAIFDIKGDGPVGAWGESNKILSLISTGGDTTGLFRDYAGGQKGILRLMNTAGEAVTNGYTILSIDAPSTNPIEATLGLVIGGGEIVDLFNMKYGGTGTLWGLRYIRGLSSGSWKDFAIQKQDLFGGTISDLLRISLPSGNVGIGTINPEFTLDVESKETNDYLPTIAISRSGNITTHNQFLSFRDGPTHDALIGRYKNSNDLIFGFWPGGVSPVEEKMRIQQTTGNVGIGTTTPTAILTSQAPTVGDVNTVLRGYDNTATSYIDLNIQPDGTANLGGTFSNFGIGTTAPTQKLDVAGQIHATGDICTDAGGGICLGTGGSSFGGMYTTNIAGSCMGTTGPQFATYGSWANPFTGNCSCPAGFTAQNIVNVYQCFGTTDCRVWLCYNSSGGGGGGGGGPADWNTMINIPAGFADNIDNTGSGAETDPTVLANVKDGVAWNELSGIPAGFADGVDNTAAVTKSPAVYQCPSDTPTNCSFNPPCAGQLATYSSCYTWDCASLPCTFAGYLVQ